MNSSAQSLWGGLRVAVLALLWGSTFLWIELALRGLSPLQVTFVRCGLGALVLVVACYTTGHRLPRGAAVWRHIAVAAFFCNALPFALFSLGQQTVDSGLAGVLNATTPLWSIALGLALGSERGIHRVRLTGLLLGFAGTIVIFAPWQTTGDAGWGALAILGAAASYAVAFTYMGRTLVRKGTPTISLSAAQLLAATGLTTVAMPVGGLERIDPSLTVVTAAVALSVLCTAITFHLTYRIINDEGATNAAVVGYLLPVVSVLLGAVVLGEDLGMRVVLGMAVVLLGVGMTRRPAAANAGKPALGKAHSGEPAAGEPGPAAIAGGAAVSGVPAGAAPAPAAPVAAATTPPEEAR
ncbi:DMT family transporter [Streptomyces sp. HNM0645]|uniref:DMT family transporter n=1 Tax=Streptomyces sp. HNM0645 TaxID=2782343 RepID=UPI0024B7292A|nr:DMT family transporter [Streptomyces sp. HNM0645]MDI9883863.1 DMT family transporter [Streptomyces sp. HNM0645]